MIETIFQFIGMFVVLMVAYCVVVAAVSMALWLLSQRFFMSFKWGDRVILGNGATARRYGFSFGRNHLTSNFLGFVRIGRPS